LAYYAFFSVFALYKRPRVSNLLRTTYETAKTRVPRRCACPDGGPLIIAAERGDRNRVFSPRTMMACRTSPWLRSGFCSVKKPQNFSRKIAPTTRLSTGKICTMSAGKVGVFQLLENFVRSICYRNARLQFAVFPTASFGRENETAPRGGTECCADQESRAHAMLGAAEKGMEACKDLGY
jgi:hypothetical protein